MNERPVSLFIPCIIDQVYPEMGMAMVQVLEHLGYSVTYSPAQTCCGQPAFNGGHNDEALAVARHFLDAFSGEETVVCPSGSCTAMVRNYYPTLFREDSCLTEAERLGSCVFELSEFLVKEGKADEIRGTFTGRVGFHNSCHSYRELHIDAQPLQIMRRISGYEFVNIDAEPVCCGFGGLFCVKFNDIAAAMATTRLEMFLEREVNVLVSNDPGCIWHMRQEVEAQGLRMRICHLAEFLAEAMGLCESMTTSIAGREGTL